MTDHTVLVTWLSFAGVFLTAFGIYAGARLTARVASKGQKSTTEIETARVDAAAYASAREIWGSLIDDLRDQVKGQRDELRTLRERIEALEHSRHLDRRGIRDRDVYIAVLQRIIREEDATYPDPPFELTTA